MKYELVEVERFPPLIEPGVLYWSREFKMSAHRCACGCGDVINLPIDALNFRISIGSAGVTLRPSVGNWGVCDAHYFITDGGVEWAAQMSREQIAASREREDARRDAHFASKSTRLGRFGDWLGSLWMRIRSRF